MIPDHARQLTILLAEDSASDASLVDEALRKSLASIKLHVVPDGRKALAFLHREEPYTDAPRPDLLLLDLNMPEMNGREVLAQIKDDPVLRSIPVTIFTSSTDDDDVRDAYDLNVNCYVPKPVDSNEFTRVINAIETFWTRVARLPPPPPGAPDA